MTKSLLIGAALATLCMGLTGCREAEDGHISYEPGVYKGQPDDVISEETREALRDRAQRQRF